jgi:hypothetical protein
MPNFTKSLDEIQWGAPKTAHYLNTNTVDPDTDITGAEEFADADEDDNLRGLTIIEPEGVLETARFLNGYHTL